MGEGQFGGNGSVRWVVNAGHIKASEPPTSDPAPPKGHKHAGVDETDGGLFRIEIELPAGPIAQDEFLTYFTAKARQGNKIKFFLPIEPDNGDQVTIRWDSRPVQNGTDSARVKT
jgi:hypothetical protein